jgi:catechol 2,3-dioxygenase-like lactoylglutathione lyase family enzyme
MGPPEVADTVVGTRKGAPMATVRYIVHDVDAAIAFYCGHLGFREVMHPAPAFAMLVRDDEPILPEAREGATREA